MGQGARAEQAHVAGIGEHCAMDARIVGQRRDRAKPGVRFRLLRGRVHPVARLCRALFDRARAQHHRALFRRQFVDMRRAQIRLARQVFGRGNIGHRSGVAGALFASVKRSDQSQDRLVRLTGDNPPIGKTAPVKIAQDMERNIARLVPAAQEIGMQRMNGPILAHRPLRRDKRLCNHLPAKHAPRTALPIVPDKAVGAGGIEMEQAQQPIDKLFGRGRFGCGFSHRPSCDATCRLRQRQRWDGRRPSLQQEPDFPEKPARHTEQTPAHPEPVEGCARCAVRGRAKCIGPASARILRRAQDERAWSRPLGGVDIADKGLIQTA